MKKFYSSSPFVHFVSFFIIGLFISWFVSLIQDGWSHRLFLNFPIVIFFLLFSYLLEVKGELTNYSKGIFYGGYFFSVGTFMSLIIYRNPFSFKLLFLYVFLAFLGTIVWLFICQHFAHSK
ncbi:hypothetical protein [Enterococcus devriesei]|uniref:hypothetical protein n=1 Tax=Enterococcus devriesei TaxID=319970 RepID=UPI0028B1588C|nr:hypothetical protein [Enterococcus devriesei]